MSPVRRPSAFLLVALLLTACAGGASSLEVSSASAGPSAAGGERPAVTVHRSATCACCGDYEDHLEAHGYEVIVEIHDDVTGFKDEAGVPDDVRSCHTNEVAGYLVEGHVPVAAIEDLLEQRPDVAGVALAGMPAGSPGMPGEQEEPFVIETFVDGEVVGELGRY